MVPLSRTSVLPNKNTSFDLQAAAMESNGNVQREYLEKYSDELSCPICKKLMKDPVYAKVCYLRYNETKTNEKF